MEQEKQMVKYSPPLPALADLRGLAIDFARSGYFQDANDVNKSVVKILAGHELGIGPVYAMTKIYIVKGRVMVSAEVMGGLIKRSGEYDYRVSEYTDAAVTIIFTHDGKDVFTSRFTLDDAKKAELVKADSGWLKWPRAMLVSKALSQGARIVCPHLISGSYTPEDFGGSTNPETGEVVIDTGTSEIIDGEVSVPTKEHWCSLHNVAFHEFKGKDGKSHWWSHKTDDGWCNEDKQKKPVSKSTDIETFPPTKEELEGALKKVEKSQADKEFDKLKSAGTQPIDMEWLRESLRTLQWSDVGKWIKEHYNITASKVSEAIEKMTPKQKAEFVAEVEKRLKEAGE